MEIYEGFVYEVLACNREGKVLKYVVPVDNRIRMDGFDGRFYSRGKLEEQKYSFLNTQVIRELCWLNEIEEYFPEDYI